MARVASDNGWSAMSKVDIDTPLTSAFSRGVTAVFNAGESLSAIGSKDFRTRTFVRSLLDVVDFTAVIYGIPGIMEVTKDVRNALDPRLREIQDDEVKNDARETAAENRATGRANTSSRSPVRR